MRRSPPTNHVMRNSGEPLPLRERVPGSGVAGGRPYNGTLRYGAPADPRRRQMSDSPSGPPDYSAVSGSTRQLTRQILWSLRPLSWLVALCVITGAAVPLVAPLQPRFDATSLIVLQQAVGRTATLPQVVRTVFEDGDVARIVVDDPALGGDPDELIPDRLDVVIELDSIVFQVVGRSSDPAEATLLSEVGAAALLDQLNRAGSSLGSFALLSPAQVPSTPAFAVAVEIQSAFGAALGWLVGLALVALVAIASRPTVTDLDVASSIGTRLLGVVDMPVVTQTFPGPRGVAGLGQVTRRITEAPTSRIMMVSESPLTLQRQALVVMVAAVLAPLRTTILTAPRALHNAAVTHAQPSRPRSAVQESRREIELIEGTGALDALDPHQVPASVILVIHRGMRQSRLRTLAGDYARQDLLGVVVLDRPRGQRATQVTGSNDDATNVRRAVPPSSTL